MSDRPKPEWYDSSPYRWINIHGEDWAARIRLEDRGTYVDLSGCDIDYEVKSISVEAPKGDRITVNEVLDAVMRFGFILNVEESWFVGGVIAIAMQWERLRDTEKREHAGTEDRVG